MKQEYDVHSESEFLFRNNMDYCIGTGRMGLALQKEYMNQLKLVQHEIGFSHIRGHGLFCDDMAIYHEYADENGKTCVEYNFTYLDMVMDNYAEVGIKPFLELGFMPEKLASGKQTVFYWKGNVTPPSNYYAWCSLVQGTLKHLMERYGADEVVTWPVEVWNEPNLPVFWENADKDEYFKLFESTFYAVKALDERFRVGGPAVCGGSDEEWITAFLKYCSEKEIALDFVTRHHYNTELPKHEGHYGYAVLTEAEYGFANLQTTRNIINSFPEYKGMEIHITEFNTSYIPNCPLHDTNLNAAYLALQLSRLGDENASYSYWTFGDIFEEGGVPFSPFHGGFGLVANGCIPKPTFWTFKFFKNLQGKCIHKSNEAVITQNDDGSYVGVIWNLQMDKENYDKLVIDFNIFARKGEYSLITKTVDENVCNPRGIWHDLGEPCSLSNEQKKLLREGAVPLVKSARVKAVSQKIPLSFELNPNAVVYFELRETVNGGDRGFRYE